jgi:hypothetical protein
MSEPCPKCGSPAMHPNVHRSVNIGSGAVMWICPKRDHESED